MPTPLEEYLARLYETRLKILDLIDAALEDPSPTYDIEDQMVDHNAYLNGLYDQLEKIDEKIRIKAPVGAVWLGTERPARTPTESG